MASPFPGMDPYLEASANWPSFHHLLADEIMAQLNEKLSPRYFADVQVRTVLEEVGMMTTPVIIPDAAVLEVEPWAAGGSTAVAIPAPLIRTAALPEQYKLRMVHVYETDSRTLITSIEILSPANKRGKGLQEYRQKRRRIMQTDVHLVEIDLLRDGERPGGEVNHPPIDTDYILLVMRAHDGETRRSEIWPLALDQPFPVIPIPLIFPDPDVPLDLGAALQTIYQRGRYERRNMYRDPVPPPELRPAMAAWLATRNNNAEEQRSER